MSFIIKHPLIGNIEVYKNDTTVPMSWNNAKRACNELGEGWRLPTKKELEIIFEQLHNQDRGDFKNETYWSSSEYDTDCARGLNFDPARAHRPYYGDKSGILHVRAVRTLP